MTGEAVVKESSNRRLLDVGGVIAWADIERYGAAIAREFRPQKIILFGSYAYGRPTPDSDVDMLVILPYRRGSRPSLEIRRRISAGFPVDILVRAPAEVARRLRQGDSFIKEVMSNGRVLYEASHA
jgi:predicted nucleotidyltransferase